MSKWNVGQIVTIINTLTNEPSGFGVITSVHEAAPLTLGASWFDVQMDHAAAGVTHRRNWDGWSDGRGWSRNQCRIATTADLQQRAQLQREASLVDRVKQEVQSKQSTRARLMLKSTNWDALPDSIVVAVAQALQEALDEA